MSQVRLYSSVQQRAPEPNTNGSTKYTLLHSHGVVPVHQDAVGLGQVLLVAAALKISVCSVAHHADEDSVLLRLCVRHPDVSASAP